MDIDCGMKIAWLIKEIEDFTQMLHLYLFPLIIFLRKFKNEENDNENDICGDIPDCHNGPWTENVYGESRH